MQFRLISLLAVVTVCCIVFALTTYELATGVLLGGLLALLLRELILFGRELQRPSTP